MNKNRPLIIGIGELLWELHPDGKKLGGLPANFVYHSKQLGAEAYIISAVGNDGFGKEILKKLTYRGIDTQYIQISGNSRTGTLSFTIDSNGNTSCLIDEPAAWDNLVWNDQLKTLASKADVICFGILAQRSIETTDLIQKFINSAKTSCLKILDLNLRYNNYSKKHVIRTLKMANILRVYKNDLKTLAEILSLKGNDDAIISGIQKQFNLNLIALSKNKGENVLISQTGKSKLIAPKVEVYSHNGSGDGFTAFLALDCYKKHRINGRKRWL